MQELFVEKIDGCLAWLELLDIFLTLFNLKLSRLGVEYFNLYFSFFILIDFLDYN